MSKTILITGATDGIGKLTAQMLVEKGHRVLLHGRSAEKLATVAAQLGGAPDTFVADLSSFNAVQAFAAEVRARHPQLDVLINNAGVLKAAKTQTADGLDLRFVVNTLAPWLLTQRLLPTLGSASRVVNLASAAQARIDLDALAGRTRLADMAAYAQSKLAIIIWTRALAQALPDGPMIVSVNPGSLLASKMVKEGFGIAGNDLSIGARILCRAALDADFANASGHYFDNDARRFGQPDAAALDAAHAAAVMQTIRALITKHAPQET